MELLAATSYRDIRSDALMSLPWLATLTFLLLLASAIAFQPLARSPLTPTRLLAASTLSQEIAPLRDLLNRASLSRTEDSQAVAEALLSLEKLMRKQNAEDEGETAATTLRALNGSWRLIFTTGTADTQKRMGRINYFPLKAVQSFDTSSGRISNGIFLGNFPVLKFFGEFEWLPAPRRLVFDFDQIAVLGLKFDLPKGGAAKIGGSTGLGSKENTNLVKQGKKPFFNWISADDEIATARGGGGGLALWRRVEEGDL